MQEHHNKINPNHENKQCVIITGSSGLLGASVIEALENEYQVIGFDRDGNPQPPPQVECVCVDITEDKSVERGLKRVGYAYGRRIAAVVHLAAYANFQNPDSPLYQKVTVEGTKRLLKHLHEQEFDVERFIFSSTMLVHAPTTPGNPITEDSPLQAKWAYPQSKIDTERVVDEYAGDYQTAVLRIAGVYTGIGTAPTIAHQIARIYEDKMTAHVYPGDISHGQAFVHLADTMNAIGLAIRKRNELPDRGTYLIGEPVTYSYDHLQRTIAKHLHGSDDWKTRVVPKPLAEAGAKAQEMAGELPGVDEPFIQDWMVDMADDHYELDITRARQELNWQPEHALIDTIPRMCQALKDNPEHWYQQNKLNPPG